MRRKRSLRNIHQGISDINLTNLIDVIMVVFIIYILIAPLVEQGINVDLPEAEAHQLKPKESVIVSVAKNGDIYIEKNKFTLTELKEQLQHRLQAKPDLGVVIKGDQGVRYGTIIKVLDELNSAGITQVGMATEVKE